MAIRYLGYCCRSKSKFKVHSPFVYTFYTEVIQDRTPSKACAFIEKHRRKLFKQKNLLETTDFGSACITSEYKTRVRTVSDVARKSSISEKYASLLYRITVFSKAENILEIGTAMGISTMYIACAAPKSHIMTMEGCAMIAQKALDGFKKHKLDNIKLIQGNFDKTLSKSLKTVNKLDLVFIDGNHKEKATVSYFNEILPKLHSGSIVVIDDIHWSKGMENAWNKISGRKEVSISIDLFRMGILIFREDIAKEHFLLKY